ncbi:hypothetical protein [Phaeodactylibacter luteus]|uniref:hypothetical protein n=1 Tax=Phaeodactylibacter luteus TaxID=1564516 RepID=UPI00147840E6|nr:hypothetical protein [Phaeodactylibacter luteus]
MRKPVHPNVEFNVQTLLIYAVLLAIAAICAQQLPEIKTFFEHYGATMKAGFPTGS